MSQEAIIKYDEVVIPKEKVKQPEQLKGFASIFSKIPTTLHVFLYSSVMSLLVLIWAINVSVNGLTFFWPMYPMFGWGFGSGYHLILYLAYNDKNKFLSKILKRRYFGVLFITHASFYISVSIYLIVLNVLYSSFPWSVFAIIGWGIGFGYHVIIASLMKSPKQPKLKSIKTEDANYCSNCGNELGDREDIKFCAFCGSSTK